MKHYTSIHHAIALHECELMGTLCLAENTQQTKQSCSHVCWLAGVGKIKPGVLLPLGRIVRARATQAAMLAGLLAAGKHRPRLPGSLPHTPSQAVSATGRTAPAARPLATLSQPVTRTRQPTASSTAPAQLLPSTTSRRRQGGKGWSSGLRRCKSLGIMAGCRRQGGVGWSGGLWGRRRPSMSGGMRMKYTKVFLDRGLGRSNHLSRLQALPRALPVLLLGYAVPSKQTMMEGL